MKRIFDSSGYKHVLTNVNLPVPKNIIVQDLSHGDDSAKESISLSKSSSASSKEVTPKKSPYGREKKKRTAKKKKKKEKSPPPPPPIDLEIPVLNTTEGIRNVIKEVNSKKTKKVTMSQALETEKKTLDEKVTRHMNFPFDKKLYKELISLKLSEKKAQQHPSTNYSASSKDKVPKLEDFYKPKKNTEYSIPTQMNLPAVTSTKQYDGLRISKVMKTWKDSRPD